MTNDSAKNFFINNPIFVKYKKRFDLSRLKSRDVLKSVNMNERIVEIPFAIAAVAALPKGATVLDLGCTESSLPVQLAALGYAVTGFDFRPYPYQHPNLTFVQGDMTQLPFEKETFASVLSISTLEHVGIGFYADPQEVAQADKKAMAEIVRVLKPGGIFVLTAPFGVKAQTPHQRIYDQKAVEDLLAALAIKDMRYFMSATLPNADCNSWVEISQEKAGAIASPQATKCVCLAIGQKK